MTPLPPLPQKKKKTEAHITREKVIKWFIKNYPRSCNVEVKIGSNKPLPHQLVTLHQTQKGVFAYKIPDMGNRNPCDFYMIKNGDGVLVTCNKENNKWKCVCEVMNGETFLITF